MSSHERAYGNEKLAKYFIAGSQPDSLLVYAQRAHEAEPASGRYWIRVGAAYEALGRYGEAIPYLEEGVRRAPDRYDGYVALGNGLVRVGRYDEAVAAYREVLRLATPRPEYFQNLGVALIRAGKPDSARVVWDDAVRRWPDYAPSARSLAVHFGSVATP
jgi:tetratricopeptide (TPR) repeat protein